MENKVKKIHQPVTLGRDINGKPIILDYLVVKHLGIYGKRNSGKTAQALNILNSLHANKLHIINLNNKEFELFKGQDNVIDYVDNVKDVLASLEELSSDLNRRIILLDEEYKYVNVLSDSYIDNRELPIITVFLPNIDEMFYKLSTELDESDYLRIYKLFRFILDRGISVGIKVIFTSTAENTNIPLAFYYATGLEVIYPLENKENYKNIYRDYSELYQVEDIFNHLWENSFLIRSYNDYKNVVAKNIE